MFRSEDGLYQRTQSLLRRPEDMAWLVFFHDSSKEAEYDRFRSNLLSSRQRTFVYVILFIIFASAGALNWVTDLPLYDRMHAISYLSMASTSGVGAVIHYCAVSRKNTQKSYGYTERLQLYAAFNALVVGLCISAMAWNNLNHQGASVAVVDAAGAAATIFYYLPLFPAVVLVDF
jgi:hypothetical protein